MQNLQDLFGIELPIVQAPMAGVQGHALAAAVCRAGGLGSLPAALLGPVALRAEIDALRAATDEPFNLNFFCHAPPNPDPEREAGWRERLAPFLARFDLDASAVGPTVARLPFGEEMARIVEELRPAVVSFHFGLPEASLLARVRRSGAKILSTATTLDEARWLEARGVDAIIAQGLEAGGHRGCFLSEDLSIQVRTHALVAQVASAVKVPVIAAGGIADAEDVAAVLERGAAGAQIGTAYLLCPEATTSLVHRAALESDAAQTTAITNLFTGRPARGIVNELMRALGPMSAEVPAFPLAATALAPLRAAAERRGSGDFSPLWAGENAGECRKVSAAELTRELGRG